MTDIGLFTNLCSIADVPTSRTPEGILWQIAIQLKEYWFWIALMMVIVVIVEILNRHKNDYNSANGFTPEFNRLVGSFSYLFLQVLLYLAIKLLVGDIAYCMPWPYLLHTAIFSLNFTILHGIGFWPEKRLPKRRRGWKW